ncbi:MAG: hypothetical protein WDO15_17680 [Bacteroidota bacterium]
MRLLLLLFFISFIAKGQIFFPNDAQQKTAVIPTFDDTPVTSKNSTATVAIDFSNIVTPVSKYMYGHNSNIYMTQMIDQDDLMKSLKQLAPNLIRFPGGTISGAYFFNALKNQRPADAPDKVLDGTGKEVTLNYWFGRNTESGTMSLDNYYKVLQAASSTGIITVNYDYARYSTANDPIGARRASRSRLGSLRQRTNEILGDRQRRVRRLAIRLSNKDNHQQRQSTRDHYRRTIWQTFQHIRRLHAEGRRRSRCYDLHRRNAQRGSSANLVEQYRPQLEQRHLRTNRRQS